ncbi:MAG: type II toxin-antitoxin system HicB family antitoxin [Pseudomonadota bacterium]
MTATRTYVAAIEQADDTFGIVFPDFPGCVSAGDSVANVLEMGREALTLHIEGMIEDGDPIPHPGNVDIETVRAQFPEGNWLMLGAITVLVPAFPDTVDVSLKADLVRRIAEQAHRQAEQISAREFVDRAVRLELDRLKKSA